MTQDYKAGERNTASQPIFRGWRGTTPRGCSPLRAAWLNGSARNDDLDRGMERAIQEAINLALGSDDGGDK